MAVGTGLVFAGEVQIDVGHLTAAVAEEGFKRDVKAVLDIGFAAQGTRLVGHIRAAAVAAVGDKLRVFALGAAIVGRQGVHLRDTGHIGHQRRAHRAAGAHQIAVVQAALHQLLRGHIHHIVLAQNTAQLHIQPVNDQRRRILAVKLMTLVPHALIQLLLGVFQPRRKQTARRQQFDLLHQIGNMARVVDDHLMRLLLPQIAEFLQHLVGGLEIDGQRGVGIGEFLAGQQNVTVDLVLRLQKMHIPGGTDGLAQRLAQADDGAVKLAQLLL